MYVKDSHTSFFDMDNIGRHSCHFPSFFAEASPNQNCGWIACRRGWRVDLSATSVFYKVSLPAHTIDIPLTICDPKNPTRCCGKLGNLWQENFLEAVGWLARGLGESVSVLWNSLHVCSGFGVLYLNRLLYWNWASTLLCPDNQVKRIAQNVKDVWGLGSRLSSLKHWIDTPFCLKRDMASCPQNDALWLACLELCDRPAKVIKSGHADLESEYMIIYVKIVRKDHCSLVKREAIATEVFFLCQIDFRDFTFQAYCKIERLKMVVLVPAGFIPEMLFCGLFDSSPSGYPQISIHSLFIPFSQQGF